MRGIATLAHSIEAELNFPVQVNTYVTAPGSRGLVPHYDDHDVLILQVQVRNWHQYDDVRIPAHRCSARQGGSARRPFAANRRAGGGRRRALPAARSRPCRRYGGGTSVHLTVGVHTPTALALSIVRCSRSVFSSTYCTPSCHRSISSTLTLLLPSLPCFSPPPPPSSTLRRRLLPLRISFFLLRRAFSRRSADPRCCSRRCRHTVVVVPAAVLVVVARAHSVLLLFASVSIYAGADLEAALRSSPLVRSLSFRDLPGSGLYSRSSCPSRCS